MENNTLFRDLHTYLIRIHDVKEELEEYPRAARKLKARIDEAEKNLKAHTDLIIKKKLEIRDKEVSIKANDEKIKKYENDLNKAAGKKEYDSMHVEIAVHKKRNDDLSDQVIQLMTEVETLNTKTPDLEKLVAAAKENETTKMSAMNTGKPALEKRLSEAEGLVKSSVGQVSAEVQPALTRLINSSGHEALSALNAKSCSACYVAVTAQQNQDIKAGRVCICKSCGKYLYFME